MKNANSLKKLLKIYGVLSSFELVFKFLNRDWSKKSNDLFKEMERKQVSLCVGLKQMLDLNIYHTD